MGNVMPFRRVVSVQQCDRLTTMEDLMHAQVTLWGAWVRTVSRIWWGA